MAEKTISSLLAEPRNVFKILDYARVENIFILYGRGHYDAMSREIYSYGIWDFFLDFATYLHGNLQSSEYHQFFHSHVWDMFADRENEIYNELNYKRYIKRQKRKYKL
jgi:hypothetical protein